MWREHGGIPYSGTKERDLRRRLPEIYGGRKSREPENRFKEEECLRVRSSVVGFSRRKGGFIKEGSRQRRNIESFVNSVTP